MIVITAKWIPRYLLVPVDSEHLKNTDVADLIKVGTLFKSKVDLTNANYFLPDAAIFSWIIVYVTLYCIEKTSLEYYFLGKNFCVTCGQGCIFNGVSNKIFCDIRME